MLNNWIKIYLHHIKNNQFFTALNILGLSLGITGLVFAILYKNDEQSYNAWNPEKDRVFVVVNDLGLGRIWGSSSAALGTVIPTALPEVESFCYLNTWYDDGVITYNDKKILAAKVTDAQKNFFTFFPFPFVYGNAATALRDVNSIALSQTVAQTLFGNENPLNKQVAYNGRTLTVTGVYKPEGKSSVAPEAVTCQIDPKLKEIADNWESFSYGLLLKLKNPAQAKKVSDKIDKLYIENTIQMAARKSGLAVDEYIKRNGGLTAQLDVLKTVRLESKNSDFPEGHGNPQFLLIMLALSILILLLSIVNYANLATANAIKRAKEVGVRKIMGATKANIIRQFMFEAVLTTLFAIVVALVLTELSLPYYNNFVNKELVISSSQFYAQMLLIFIIVVVLAGILPAIYVANFDAVKVIKGNFTRSKSGIWLRNGMLIVQFAIASLFITGSYIVSQQINYLSTKNLGFNGSQVLDVHYRNGYDYTQKDFQSKVIQKFNSTKVQLLNMPGVERVAPGMFKFGISDGSHTMFKYGSAEVPVQNMAVDFGLLQMLHIKIKLGRDLSQKFSSDTITSVLINETALKMMKEKNPIGKEIELSGGGPRFRIVGIVANFSLNGPNQEIQPMLFFHYKTIPWSLQNVHDIYITIKPEYIATTLPKIEKLWTEKTDPDYPFNYSFVDKSYARSYEDYVKQRNLFRMLNIVVIAIALFGLFALTSYSIQRKMKEIAIRKTLGAETKTLLIELSKQYIVYCTIGFFIATIPAWLLLNAWLDNFAFRIQVSPTPFIAGFIVLMALTLLVVLSRAYAATRVNVLEYLKYE